MRIHKSLIFIFSVIALLALVCLFFPADGVKIGGWTLRFPTLQSVMRGNAEDAKEKELQEAATMADELARQQARIDSLAADSVARQEELKRLYEQVMTENISRIYFPNDDFSYFDAFYEAAAAARHDGRTIRVVHYGDSQIELDRISSTLRRYFQGLFGGGGPGMLPVVQSCPSPTVSQWASENYSLYSPYGVANHDKSGQYGIMAKSYRVAGSGSCSVTRSYATRVRLLLNDRKGNFSATLTSDDFTEIQECDSVGGFRILEWHLPAAAKTFKLNFSGIADLFAILADCGAGIAVDNIPMRGCSGTMFTQISSELLRQSYRQTDVGMIILQYGGNAMPALRGKGGVEAYANNIGRQIRYLKQVCPNTPILFIGPSDMSTTVNGTRQSYPLMDDVVEALKTAALDNGAAFWNMYEVMGGHNSMLAWVSHGLAGTDYVHFSSAGANKIAQYLQEAFEFSYQHYRIGKGEQVVLPTEATTAPEP